MNLLEKLFERYLSKKNHENGTYVAAQLDEDCKQQLYDWVKGNGVDADPPDDYHATIVYSRKGVPQVESHDFQLPIHAMISGWKLFNTQDGGKCLVAALESNDLHLHHNHIREQYGATYDFPSYQPHVTVSYKHEGDAPATYPTFPLTFSNIKVEALDPQKKVGK